MCIHRRLMRTQHILVYLPAFLLLFSKTCSESDSDSRSKSKSSIKAEKQKSHHLNTHEHTQVSTRVVMVMSTGFNYTARLADTALARTSVIDVRSASSVTKTVLWNTVNVKLVTRYLINWAVYYQRPVKYSSNSNPGVCSLLSFGCSTYSQTLLS